MRPGDDPEAVRAWQKLLSAQLERELVLAVYCRPRSAFDSDQLRPWPVNDRTTQSHAVELKQAESRSEVALAPWMP